MSSRESTGHLQRFSGTPHTLLSQLKVVLPSACPGSGQEVASQSYSPRRCLYQVPDPPRLIPLVLWPDPEAPSEIRRLSRRARPLTLWRNLILTPCVQDLILSVTVQNFWPEVKVTTNNWEGKWEFGFVALLPLHCGLIQQMHYCSTCTGVTVDFIICFKEAVAASDIKVRGIIPLVDGDIALQLFKGLGLVSVK